MPATERPTFRLDLTAEFKALREFDRERIVSEAETRTRLDNLEQRWREDANRRATMTVVIATGLITIFGTLVYMLLTLNA